MNKAIYYYSGTGNSYVVAKEIQDVINGDLISIPEVFNNNINEINYDVVGLVFPLYFYSMPQIIMEFIEKSTFKNVKYIFSIVTRGGPMNGGALNHLDKLLKKKNLSLSAGFYVRMPDNYIIMLKAPAKDKQEKIFIEASKKTLEIAKLINNNTTKIAREPFSLIRPLPHKFYLNMIRKPHKFWTNNKCNSCGICEKICKVNNIKLDQNKKPAWNNKCQQCVACINYCPQEAIEYGKATDQKERYFHPEVPVNKYLKI